jgi:tricarballylate dehydrogenase
LVWPFHRRSPDTAEIETIPAACDVLVVGGGIAGLCAAIAARRAGESVVLVDQSPRWMRGGDTRHARNFRIVHDAPSPFVPDTYTRDEFLGDLRRIGRDGFDTALADVLADGAADIAPWLAAQGVRYQRADDGMLPYSRRTIFFEGGGRAAINTLYATAQALGIVLAHETEARALHFENGRIVAVDLSRGGSIVRIATRALVACSGGAHADRDFLRKHLGVAADHIVIRGNPHATGSVLRKLLDAGARETGDGASAHLVAVDARGPKTDGGIVTRVECIPQGIVVDRNGERFADEGGDLARTHYARWGERLLHAPDGAAFVILDSAGLSHTTPMALEPVFADTVGDLARALGLPAAQLEHTVATFNAATTRGHAEQGGRRTIGLDPPKSAGAIPLVAPPFAGVPMRPGLTFIRYGVAVDISLRVMTRDGEPMPNVFAAGMIMAANVMPHSYLAGLAVGMCAVFGRRAGAQAAACALASRAL